MDLVGRFLEGATPHAKPRVTMIAAAMTLIEGMLRVVRQENRIVSGRTSPRAIYDAVRIKQNRLQ